MSSSCWLPRLCPQRAGLDRETGRDADRTVGEQRVPVSWNRGCEHEVVELLQAEPSGRDGGTGGLRREVRERYVAQATAELSERRAPA